MPTEVQWDPALATGDLDVDAQHMRLFELVRVMEEQIAEGRGHEAVRESMDQIAAYAHSHFAFEEALMADVDFPGLDAQVAQHRAFTEEIDSLSDQLLAGQSISPRGMLDYLSAWLVQHIAVEDRKIGEYIRARGL
jgi:hemerythrin-like metal-binding protein